MDDTGLQEYPVIFMNVKEIKFDMKRYEDIDDAADFIMKVSSLFKLCFLENGHHLKKE
jgi:hypothetical protein